MDLDDARHNLNTLVQTTHLDHEEVQDLCIRSYQLIVMKLDEKDEQIAFLKCEIARLEARLRVANSPVGWGDKDEFHKWLQGYL